MVREMDEGKVVGGLRSKGSMGREDERIF